MSATHLPEYLPTTREIRGTFADEIAALGGTVPDVYDDGHRLFARAVLPRDEEVRPDDRVRAGVAIRATGPELLVRPYTFRQVCTNGAIMAHALRTRRVERVDVFTPPDDAVVVLAMLCDEVRACAASEVFSVVVQEMRSSADVEADLELQLMSRLAHMPAAVLAHVAPLIFERFAAGRDPSVFGLMNAVTSVARDTRDPDTRWRLEELGGSMPARLTPKPKVVWPTAALVEI